MALFQAGWKFLIRTIANNSLTTSLEQQQPYMQKQRKTYNTENHRHFLIHYTEVSMLISPWTILKAFWLNKTKFIAFRSLCIWECCVSWSLEHQCLCMMCCLAVWHSVMGQEGGLGRQGKATAKSELIFQTILGIPFQWLEANGQLRWLLASQRFCMWASKSFCTRNGAGCYLCSEHNAQ